MITMSIEFLVSSKTLNLILVLMPFKPHGHGALVGTQYVVSLNQVLDI
jgi:hypothetical protein